MCRGWERPTLRGFRVGYAALVAPTPDIPRIQKKYLARIFHRFALDTNRISSASVTDLYRSQDRYTQDRNLIHRRTP